MSLDLCPDCGEQRRQGHRRGGPQCRGFQARKAREAKELEEEAKEVEIAFEKPSAVEAVEAVRVCGFHLPGNRQCPNQVLFSIVWSVLIPGPPDRMMGPYVRLVCEFHLTDSIRHDIEFQGEVIIKLV